MKTRMVLFHFLFFLATLHTVAQVTFQKTYLIGGSSSGYSFQITPDSGYIIAGPCDDSLGSAMFLLKLNSIGDTVWSKLYKEVNLDYGFVVVQCYDGGYAVIGNSINLPGYA